MLFRAQNRRQQSYECITARAGTFRLIVFVDTWRLAHFFYSFCVNPISNACYWAKKFARRQLVSLIEALQNKETHRPTTPCFAYTCALCIFTRVWRYWRYEMRDRVMMLGCSREFWFISNAKQLVDTAQPSSFFITFLLW